MVGTWWCGHWWSGNIGRRVGDGGIGAAVTLVTSRLERRCWGGVGGFGRLLLRGVDGSVSVGFGDCELLDWECSVNSAGQAGGGLCWLG